LIVPHQDADVIAFADTECLQRPRGLLRLGKELVIVEPAALRHQGFLRPALAGLAREHLPQRLLGPARGLPIRHAFPIHSPAASCSSIASISACSAPAGSSSTPRSMVRLASFSASG